MANGGPAPGIGWWRGAVLSLLLVSYLGFATVYGALETRRKNAALDQEGVRVTGVIVSYSESKPGRRGGKRQNLPTVKYVVEGRDYLAHADRGTGATGLREPPVGSPLDVVHLPGRPHVVRVVGYEARGWEVTVIAGSFLFVPPLAVLVFLLLRNRLSRATRRRDKTKPPRRRR